MDIHIDKQNKENGLQRKTWSKEAIRKIVFKQTMWRVYRRTRKDEDYVEGL